MSSQQMEWLFRSDTEVGTDDHLGGVTLRPMVRLRFLFVLHRQYVFLWLGTSGSVPMLSDWNCMVVRVGRRLNQCSWLQVYQGAPVTHILWYMWSSDDQWSTGECRWHAREHLRLEVTSQGALRITVEQSGKHYIIFGNAACVSGHDSYYSSLNKLSM